MLLDKYKPKQLEDFLGNTSKIQKIKQLIAKKKPVLLQGPSGSGKSLAVELIAKELNLELIELSTIDQSNDFLEKAAAQQSLMYKGKLLVIEGIDGLTTTRGISSLLEKSKHPVVATAVDAYDSKLRNLRSKCKLVKFSRVRWNSIAKFLREICDRENYKWDSAAISHIARTAGGDVRAALTDLEMVAPDITMQSVKKLPARRQEEDIFRILKLLFKTKQLENVKAGFRKSDKTPRELFLWLEENIAQCFEGPDIARAFENLARADYFNSLVRKRQAWSLYKYYIFFLQQSFLSGQCNRFVRYKPPQIFNKKRPRQETLEKIAKQLHCSKKEALEALPLARKYPQEFSFDKDDVKFLKKW